MILWTHTAISLSEFNVCLMGYLNSVSSAALPEDEPNEGNLRLLYGRPSHHFALDLKIDMHLQNLFPVFVTLPQFKTLGRRNAQ